MIVYREAASLARDLGVETRTLYALSNNLPAHYHTVLIQKADGGQRRHDAGPVCQYHRHQ